MPDLDRYGRGTQASARPGCRFRGGGLHVRPRHVPRSLREAAAGFVLALPLVYLAAGYGAGTHPLLAYLAGLGLLAAARLVRGGRR